MYVYIYIYIFIYIKNKTFITHELYFGFFQTFEDSRIFEGLEETEIQLVSNKCSAQVHELPQSHCGDNREGTLFS